MITSHNNPVLKQIRKLLQRRRGDSLFVAEGEDLVAEARAAGWEPIHHLRAGHEIDAELLARTSGLASGSREVAVYEERWATPVAEPLCVALWGVKDPGNVGAAIRSALAFGASCVALGPETADPFSPKAVRASMGAVFRVPLARVAAVSRLPGRRVALVAHAGERLRGPLAGPVSLVVGPERTGIPPEVLAACDATAHIPIRFESLNAAIAASVAMYELLAGASTQPANKVGAR